MDEHAISYRISRENLSEKVTPPFLHFIVEISKYTEKFKEFYSEYSYTYLDSITNILLNVHEQRLNHVKGVNHMGKSVWEQKKKSESPEV